MIRHPVHDNSALMLEALASADRLSDAFKLWRVRQPLDQLRIALQYQCKMATDALEAIGHNAQAGEIAIALSELQRRGGQCKHGKKNRASFEESIDHFARVVSDIRRALDRKPALNVTDRAIANLVIRSGPLTGKQIVAKLPDQSKVSESQVRRILSQKLVPYYGFFNLRDQTGYHSPPPPAVGYQSM